MSNKSDGNTFEQECAEILYRHGFWVHLLQQNSAGQPADIIAAKNGKTFLIDAKNCTRPRFDLRRIEENQDYAMTMWKERGNKDPLFFIKMNDVIYVLKHRTLKTMKADGFKTIAPTDCFEYGLTIDRWLHDEA